MFSNVTPDHYIHLLRPKNQVVILLQYCCDCQMYPFLYPFLQSSSQMFNNATIIVGHIYTTITTFSKCPLYRIIPIKKNPFWQNSRILPQQHHQYSQSYFQCHIFRLSLSLSHCHTFSVTCFPSNKLRPLIFYCDKYFY